LLKSCLREGEHPPHPAPPGGYDHSYYFISTFMAIICAGTPRG
jgi:hypothetical protein